MSSMEQIIGELRALTAGVDRAQVLTAAVDRQAQEIALRAAAAGFAGIAAGITQVRATVSTIQGGLGSLAAAVGEATTAAAAVPRQAATQETITALAPVQQRITAARESATATINHLDDARNLVSVVLQGGQPGPLLQALDGVNQVLVLVVHRAGTAGQAVEAATGQARQLGASGN
ncbi:DUF6244 family protein [Micromonospora carbonacea]|uniref:DUF6244 family protein n=1 Tax=Micromonospora carbonacea TaxID=47853 RepID=UPI003713E729